MAIKATQVDAQGFPVLNFSLPTEPVDPPHFGAMYADRERDAVLMFLENGWEAILYDLSSITEGILAEIRPTSPRPSTS